MSLADLEVGAAVYQRDCLQVQCDDGVARWQPEPCNSNNFLPICRVGTVSMCASRAGCLDSDAFCGGLSLQDERLDWKIPNAEELIKAHVGGAAAFQTTEKPTYRRKS